MPQVMVVWTIISRCSMVITRVPLCKPMANKRGNTRTMATTIGTRTIVVTAIIINYKIIMVAACLCLQQATCQLLLLCKFKELWCPNSKLTLFPCFSRWPLKLFTCRRSKVFSSLNSLEKETLMRERLRLATSFSSMLSNLLAVNMHLRSLVWLSICLLLSLISLWASMKC